MIPTVFIVLSLVTGARPAGATTAECVTTDAQGPSAALEFARRYQGETHLAGEFHCYPDAKGIPFSDTENIIPMTAEMWTPQQLRDDFQKRMAELPESGRKKGIIVILKTERCATKPYRLCSITTAALEKRSTPLAAQFLIYGAWLKPRDNDNPPGSLKIEIGKDTWKNDAAAQYQFKQGPGATISFIDPRDGSIVDQSDAAQLRLFMDPFTQGGGATPGLHTKLEEILRELGSEDQHRTQTTERDTRPQPK